MLYGRCSSLLQLGRNQATSLVPAIGLLAEVSPVLSLFTGFPRQSTSGQLQRQLGQVFDRTLDVLDGMTSYFQDLSIGLGTATGPSGLRSSLSKQLEAFDLQAEQLRNEIWNDCSPSNADEPDIHFEQIRQLLQPQDEVVRSTQKILLGERSSRHEFTCEWFSKPFLDFVRSSDSAVWVDGRIGCGKSVLYGWILESLESPLDGREYAVIAHAIDPLLPSETNIVCVIKTLLWHLIKRQYGPGNMHKALVKLATTVKTGGGSFDVESALWECLQIAIGDALQPTMIVIDGLSEIDGGEATATALFQKLLNSVEGNPSVRLLVLSRPFTFSPIAHLRRRNIEGRDVHKDIRRVITDWVPSGSLTPSAEVARRIDHEADGNFFWSLLAFQEWKAHNFSLQTWRDLPTSLDTIVAKLISRIDLSDPTTGTIFFSSIIARRPLRVSEVEHLLRLDTDTKTLKAQAPDVTRAIEEGCMSVLVVQDGIVLFRHALLKQGVLDSLRTGTRSIAPELHANMALRLLLYLKIVLGQRSELTLKLAPSSAIEDLLHGHPLLPYALRYWVSHVGASPSESFQANTGLKTFFPDTIHAATVEASFWIQNLTHESLRNLSIAAKVRNAILGSQEATLQTISLLAEALRSTKDFTGAALEFGVALELAQDILPEFHSFTATCMLKFLHVIDFADANEISDLSSRKADVLRYVISMYDTQIGPSSDQSIQYRYSLAGHYAHVQDFALSAEMYKDIHRLNIERHGKDSSEARLSAERVMTALQSPSEEGPNRYSDAVYDDILRTYDVTDARRIKASMAKAETYKAFDDLFNAELVYIGLWHGVAEACHRQKTLENHERLLETGIAYAQFLRENNRFSDAQTVLLGLRSQQSAVKYKSDTTINLLEQVAAEMKHAGLQDMALEILRDVLAWSETDADSGINKAISDITLEMARGAKSDISSNTALELSPTDASEVNPVISKLIDGHRFADVIAFASKTLYGLWPAIVHRHEAQTPTALDRFDPDLVKLAASLAHAYVKTDNIEEAASIYWYLFQTTRHPDAAHHDTTAAEYGDLAFDAFSQTGEIDRSIAVREDLVDYHITKCGRDHSSTIESLYALASLYMQEHLFEKAKRQYSQIADTLKRSGQPDFHLPAAIPALRRLIEIYSRERSFDNALKVYSWLWNTFMVKGSEFGLESSAAKRVYKDYTGLLRRLDSTKIHVVTESYRSLCLALWGERDEATLEASLLLADSWNSQKRVTEAIKLYEWLVDGHDDVQQESSRAIVEAAESRLTDLYQTDISDDAQTITRAVRLQGKRYEKEKTSQDPSHLTTLSSLAIWISVLTKEGSSDSRVVAVGELQLAINAIIESDAQPSSLYSAAVLLATSFSANGYVEEGLRTVQRLTEQVVFQEGESDQRARRSNLVFLTAFEAHLTGSTMDFAEIHAKVLLESALWESYKRLGQEDAEPGMTLAYGARLRTFLVKHNAFDRAAFIERDLFERFMDHYGEAFTRGIQSARGAFLLLVQELSEERLQFDIPTLATAALVKNVGSQLEEGHYQSALDLAFPGFEFIQFVGAFTCGDNSSLVNGLELGLMLACVDAAPAPDHTTATQLLELSKSILQETLRECRSQNFNLNVVSIDLISRVASVLGLQQNYEYLEVRSHTADRFRVSMNTNFDLKVATDTGLAVSKCSHIGQPGCYHTNWAASCRSPLLPWGKPPCSPLLSAS